MKIPVIFGVWLQTIVGVHCQYYYKQTVQQALTNVAGTGYIRTAILEYPVTATPYYFAGDGLGTGYTFRLTGSAGNYASAQLDQSTLCSRIGANGKNIHLHRLSTVVYSERSGHIILFDPVNKYRQVYSLSDGVRSDQWSYCEVNQP